MNNGSRSRSLALLFRDSDSPAAFLPYCPSLFDAPLEQYNSSPRASHAIMFGKTTLPIGYRLSVRMECALEANQD